MTNQTGEHVLDALVALGYQIEITDDGHITATNGERIVTGKAEHGAIEWADRSQIFHITEQAYIVRLRKRVAQSQG